jgi:dethiobiotin synthetase
MLSWNVLKSAGINVIALVISGTPNTSTESYFVTQMDVPFIRINELEEVNSGTIAKEAVRLRSLISELADWRISE